MSYKYSVFHFSIGVFITEDSEVSKNEWSISRLKKSIDTISKLERPSYTRTRKWIEENQPELLI